MNPTPSREEEIFTALVALPVPQRAAYLDSACRGDAALRQRIEKLLWSHDEAEGFLRSPIATEMARAVAQHAPPQESAGRAIGRYKLLQRIGEGGCGVVYMAEQQEPVRRRVALKVIKLGMDTKEVIARFEAERQALALMDHVNIARVFDAGATDTGRPFFVMELVRGVPITKYCDEHNLPTTARLELFTLVCHAVQHAHQKGIIHRDLKPSNILVTINDGVAAPKVIDFGIAKATQGRLTDSTVFTAFEQFIGTPAYMSPEQAEMTSLDVDTRSDIYSLGVLLYELLTGRPPFDPKTLVVAGLDEIRRIIREEEPPRPSTRLSTLNDLDRATIAKQRGILPGQLSTLLRGDLDWIVMRCLEKDRTRRYETANGLALDVLRHLHDEPVVARPASAAYRFQKLVRRNKLAFTGGTLLVVTLALGLACSAWQAIRANAEATRANQAEQTARNEAAVAKAVNDFLNNDVLSQAGGWRQADQGFSPNPNLSVRQALDRASKRLDGQFQDAPQVEAAIRQTIGNAYWQLGEYRMANAHYERAVELRRRVLGHDHASTLASMADLAWGYLNASRVADAVKLGEEVVQRNKTIFGADHAETLRSMFNLAISYRAAGRSIDAMRLMEETVARSKTTLGTSHRDTLRSMNRLAELYFDDGRRDEGIALSDATVKQANVVLGGNHPVTLVALGTQSNLYRGVGRLAEAIAIAEEALRRSKASLGTDHVDAVLRMHGLADLYRDAGRIAEALPLYREAISISKIKLGDEHTNTLRAMECMAVAYRKHNDFGREEELLREVLGIRQRKDGPGSVGMAHAALLLGKNLIAQGKFIETESILRPLLTSQPKQTPEKGDSSAAAVLLGEALTGLRNFSEAESLLLRGYEGVTQRKAPASSQRDAIDRLVQLYAAWEKPEKASEWREKLDEFNQAKTTKSPSPPK